MGRDWGERDGQGRHRGVRKGGKGEGGRVCPLREGRRKCGGV